jgi:enamine deaminase RidA (YjgF/YER057c/UK114 family)
MMLSRKAEPARRVVTHRAGYSVIDLQALSHLWVAAVPRPGTPLEQQVADALRTIEAAVRAEGGDGSVVSQAVFAADPAALEACPRLLRAFYGNHFPATTYIRQRPCAGTRVAVEALALVRGEATVRIERVSEELVIASHNGLSWVHCAQVVPRTDARRVYDRSGSAFAGLPPRLARAAVRCEQVVRVWLYLGDIVGMEGREQRYQELNRARTDFFARVPFPASPLPGARGGTVYPASTGIGTDGTDIVMSCLALATQRADVRAVPLENPRQTAAYDYAAHYSPKSPKFSRAMAVAWGAYATLFVSGTASITRSESRHPGDATAQTHEVLDNIEALIGEDNLARHGLPGAGATLRDLGVGRVYVKRLEDYAKIRRVCEARLGEVPLTYTLADVCRPELLVEIEGVAYSGSGGGAGVPYGWAA